MSTEATEQRIRTEDGVIVKAGERVYNYYDMKPGIIQRISDPMSRGREDEPIDINRDIWFYFRPDKGQDTILNGERICSMAYAKRRNFKDA